MRRAILVVGGHRTGTSAITRVLSLLGADLPRNLLPPQANDNETGFWESADLMAIHDELLASIDSSFEAIAPPPREWFDSDEARGIADRILEVLARDFTSSRLFAVKDPRICRLLPLWRRVLDAFGAEATYVLTLRHPTEVTASLVARNGFSPEHSMLLWLRHLLEAERETRRERRTVVRYSDLLCDWRSVAGSMASDLGITWPIPVGTAASAVEAFLDIRMRHHDASGDLACASHAFRGSQWIADAYEALSAPGTLAAAAPVLDRIGAEVEAADALFGRELSSSRRKAALWAQQSAAELDVRREVKRLRAEVEVLAERSSRLERELQTTRSELDRWRESWSWRLTAPLRAIARKLRRVTSAEPELVAPEFVVAAYRGILGREPDAAGLRYHRTQILAGRDRRETFRDLIESEEFDERLRATLECRKLEEVVAERFAVAVYRLLLDREPTDSEVLAVGVLDGDRKSRRRFLLDLATGAEFARRLGDYSVNACDPRARASSSAARSGG